MIRITVLSVFLHSTVSAGNVLTVEGDRFRLKGKPYDMWGIRVASASQSQDLTDSLIANLDDYSSYGVNTVTVFVQGSSGGFSDPFSPDDKSIDAGHLTRIRQIIEACDKRHDPELSVDEQNRIYVTAFGFRFNICTPGRWSGERVFAPITRTKVGDVETCGPDGCAYAVWEEGNQVLAVDEVPDKPEPAAIVIGRIFPDGTVCGILHEQ